MTTQPLKKGKMVNPVEKVYCENCKYVSLFGSERYICTNRHNIEYKDTPRRIETIYLSVCDANKNNDCGYYKRHGWFTALLNR